MWLRRISEYLLKHYWQAVVFAFVGAFLSTYIGRFLSNLPVVVSLLGVIVVVTCGMFAILLAGLITLVRGTLYGLLVTIAATVPYFFTLLPGMRGVDVPLLTLWAGIAVAVLSNLLTWVFAAMLHQKVSWSKMLQVAALLGVLTICLIHFAYPDVDAWWGAQLKALQDYYAEATAAVHPVTSAPEGQGDAITAAKQFATGTIVAAILLNAFVQLVAARWWQSALFNPRGLQKELRSIHLSPLAGLLFVASLVLSYMGNMVVLDLMPVVYLLFAVAGLSLVHYLFGLVISKTVWFWLAVFYLTLIFTWPYSIMMIAILALVDIVVDIRKRVRQR